MRFLYFFSFSNFIFSFCIWCQYLLYCLLVFEYPILASTFVIFVLFHFCYCFVCTFPNKVHSRIGSILIDYLPGLHPKCRFVHVSNLSMLFELFPWKWKHFIFRTLLHNTLKNIYLIFNKMKSLNFFKASFMLPQ